MPGTDPNALSDRIAEIREALISDFDPLAEIRGIIPPDFVDAAEYNENYLSDRRARRTFRGMDIFSDLSRYSRIILKKAQDLSSEDWSDVAIVRLISSGDAETRSAAKILESSPPENPGIIYALHNHSSVLAETLLQYASAGQLFQNEIDPQVRNSLQEMLTELKEAVFSLAQWENWTFYHKDGIIKKDPSISETAFVSGLMEKIFTCSFNPHHRALSLHVKLDPQYRMMVNGVLRQLLDFTKPIVIRAKDLDRTGEIFQAMSKLGMIAPLEEQDRNKEQEWEVESEIGEDNPIWPLWSFLLYNVLGVTHQEGEVRFIKILKTFREIPNGLNDNFIRIIFAVFWRCYHDYIDLYDARDFDQEPVENLTPDISAEMLKTPGDWKMVKTGAKPSEKELPVTDLLSREEKYMRSIVNLFDPDGFDEERFDYTWDEARDRALDWHSRVAKLVTAPGAVSTEIFSLVKILEGSREIDSRELFLAIIPNLFGFEPNPDQLIHDPDNLSRSIKTVIEDMDDLTRDLSVKSKKIYKRQSKVAWDALSDELSLTSESGSLFDTPSKVPPARPGLQEPSAATPPPVDSYSQRTISIAGPPPVIEEIPVETFEEPQFESGGDMFMDEEPAFDFNEEEVGFDHEPRLPDEDFPEETADAEEAEELIPTEPEEPFEEDGEALLPEEGPVEEEETVYSEEFEEPAEPFEDGSEDEESFPEELQEMPEPLTEEEETPPYADAEQAGEEEVLIPEPLEEADDEIMPEEQEQYTEEEPLEEEPEEPIEETDQAELIDEVSEPQESPEPTEEAALFEEETQPEVEEEPSVGEDYSQTEPAEEPPEEEEIIPVIADEEDDTREVAEVPEEPEPPVQEESETPVEEPVPEAAVVQMENEPHQEEASHEDEHEKSHKADRFKLARPDFKAKASRPHLVEHGAGKPPFVIRNAHEEQTANPEEKLWEQVKSLFSLKDDGETARLKGWLDEIKADKYVRAYRGDTKLLYDALIQDGPPKERLLSELLEKMGIGPVSRWTYDRGPEFIARIDKARYQMSVMKYLEMKALPKTDKGRIFLIKWLLKVLKHLKMTPRESRQFLQEYLKTLQKS